MPPPHFFPNSARNREISTTIPISVFLGVAAFSRCIVGGLLSQSGRVFVMARSPHTGHGARGVRAVPGTPDLGGWLLFSEASSSPRGAELRYLQRRGFDFFDMMSGGRDPDVTVLRVPGTHVAAAGISFVLMVLSQRMKLCSRFSADEVHAQRSEIRWSAFLC